MLLSFQQLSLSPFQDLTLTISEVEKATGVSLEKIRQILFDSRITILLLCLFIVCKLPIAILQYAHYFHMVRVTFVQQHNFLHNFQKLSICD